jgi:D-cysteine desulfhydrase
MLVAQVNARHVRDNLLASWCAGAELHHYPDERGLPAAVRYQLARHEAATGAPPYVIAGGGSAPLGVVGFVDAAFELKAQIDAGVLPPPGRIYVALGTTGTAAGLRLGLDAAGLTARLVAVRVVHADIGSPARLARLYGEASALLAGLDPAFPRRALDPATIELRHEHYGARYALYTPAGQAAVAQARARDGLELEGTYTGKAFAALLDDLRERGDTGPVLFWHSYSTRPLAGLDEVDYRALPRAFHAYFEQDVQPLDRD